MEEKLIKSETAKLAKEKGFDSRLIIDKIFNTGSNICTQALLQKWCREVHDIHVNPVPYRETADHSNSITGYYMGEIWNGSGKLLSYGDDEFTTYEEALEAGLLFALKLI